MLLRKSSDKEEEAFKSRAACDSRQGCEGAVGVGWGVNLAGKIFLGEETTKYSKQRLASKTKIDLESCKILHV